MPLPVLVTQCLQRDFVALLDAHEPLPNALHVGRAEATRLLGTDPSHGPLAQLTAWARARSGDELHTIHVRDWHDATDPRQSAHLREFGAHCLQGSPGAELVLDLASDVAAGRATVVDAIGLNDCEHTTLAAELERLREKSPDGTLRIGVVGVWTEAKVTFLLYDLKTRLGVDELATCSALTASASRSQHFNALDQLRKILGVTVLDSVGDFAAWLVPDAPALRATPAARGARPDIQGATLDAADDELVSFLYRDASRLVLQPLTGGFSGAQVFRVQSFDALGHELAPSVAKVGPRSLVGKERVAFERVEGILGNDAPQVRGFADIGDRAGIKYAYAAMGRGAVRTFKQLWEQGAPEALVERVLRETFEQVLGRFYAVAQYEKLPLLAYYGFDPKWAQGVRERAAQVSGESPFATEHRLSAEFVVPNVASFYDDALPRLVAASAQRGESHYVSWVHGDLNGANILVDGRDNVWLIDFFHAHRGHVLRDLAKLENDLLYIFTPLRGEAELAQALRLTRTLREVSDLRAVLPETVPFVEAPQLLRAWRTVRLLRSMGAALCREDRDPTQLSIALLRYAVHTLSFDESSPLQKRWALGAAGAHAEEVTRALSRDQALQVGWIAGAAAPRGGGRLGVTLCPGRTDRGRSLRDDVATLKALGVSRFVTFATSAELEWAGVPDLVSILNQSGIRAIQRAIPDQGTATAEEMREVVAWLREGLARGENVVAACLGGLGRSGMAAACVLVEDGAAPEDAIAAVRGARGPRAVESAAQERFVRDWQPVAQRSVP